MPLLALVPFEDFDDDDLSQARGGADKLRCRLFLTLTVALGGGSESGGAMSAGMASLTNSGNVNKAESFIRSDSGSGSRMNSGSVNKASGSLTLDCNMAS